jgi:mannan endo-1,4-beta-mannosidase
MYGYAGGTQSMIKNIMDSMITRQLCLVIGEFGYKHSDGDVDEGYIMEYAQKTNTGWLAWSWYGNGSPVEYLDMSNANAGGTLSKDWGEVVINGKNGWKATAKPCTVFTGEQPASVTTTVPMTTETTVTTTTTTVSTTVTSETTTVTETTVAETTVTEAVTTTTTARAVTTTVTSTTVETTQAPARQNPGDVNESGAVDVSDAVLICRYAVEDQDAKISAQGLKNADCDGIPGVNANDALRVLRFIAKFVSAANMGKPD